MAEGRHAGLRSPRKSSMGSPARRSTKRKAGSISAAEEAPPAAQALAKVYLVYAPHESSGSSYWLHRGGMWSRLTRILPPVSPVLSLVLCVMCIFLHHAGERKSPARAKRSSRCCGRSACCQRRHTPAKQPISEACSCQCQRWRTSWQEVRPRFAYQLAPSSLGSLSHSTNIFFLPTLNLEYTSRSAQATPRRSERSVTRRESRGQQVSC